MKPLYSLLLISLVLILSSNSCRKGGPCEEPPDIKTASSVVVSFIDKQSGKYLYTETNSLYNRDSFIAFDNSSNRLFATFQLQQIPNTPNRYYVVGIGPVYNVQTDEVAFNSEICKEFFLNYNNNEKDTLKICFKAKSTKCGSVFESLKVFHRDSLISSISNGTYTLINIYKN